MCPWVAGGLNTSTPDLIECDVTYFKNNILSNIEELEKHTAFFERICLVNDLQTYKDSHLLLN